MVQLSSIPRPGYRMSTRVGGSDRRRYTGPEDCIQPLQPDFKTKVSILNGELMRVDGRYPEDIRPLVIRKGVITCANGSAYVEQGHTKLICSVYGPRSSALRAAPNARAQATAGTFTCHLDYAPFATPNRTQYAPDEQEQEAACLLTQALKPAIDLLSFPGAFVDVFVTVLQDDGASLAAAINGCTVALCQAGIPMLDTPVAVGLVATQTQVLLDPNAVEIKLADSRLVFSYLPHLDTLTQTMTVGRLEMALLQEALSMATEATRALYEHQVKPALLQ